MDANWPQETHLGGSAPAPRMRRAMYRFDFSVFHEHVFLCVKPRKAITMLRSGAPQGGTAPAAPMRRATYRFDFLAFHEHFLCDDESYVSTAQGSWHHLYAVLGEANSIYVNC